MKASPLLVSWHDDNAPVYSAHFEPHGKGRLATAGGDHNVRLWKLEYAGEERKVTYLSTLIKHTQAVNVVRWCPKGELLASAGDDGNTLLWIPSENPSLSTGFGDDVSDDLEHWRVKTMCRSSSGSEIYDLAWSPDGKYFITGSMDNVARVYNATTGTTIRQIAEHNHYVQGVAWDPLNEFIATQSSDRSVHIYTLKTKDGQPSLSQHNKVARMDLPARSMPPTTSVPPEPSSQRTSFVQQDSIPEAPNSPKPSAPGTPQSLALPMNPPATSHSRRSSFGSQFSQSMRRSVSPSPSMPLPAVMPPASPNVSGFGLRNVNIYANETFTSFFRRLTFAPDGSLLFTPAGQFKTSVPSATDGSKSQDDIINTVYIYTRGGLNKPPIAYLPGHKRPSLAVKCSPVYYTLRLTPPDTKEITIDTGSTEDISELPAPIVPSKAPVSHAAMEPPPLTSAPSPAPSVTTAPSPKTMPDSDTTPITPSLPPGPPPTFALPYRIVYAVATQDAIHVYDTQQQKPLCVVSNLHYATFTDLTWSNDGLTLLMSSSDGFCSTLSFSPGELGVIYHQPPASRQTPTPISIQPASSTVSTPQQTPTTSGPPPPALSRPPSITSGSFNISAGSPSLASVRPASPARSMSASSIATEASFARAPDQNAPPVMNYPTPSLSSMPSVAAAGSSSLPLFTPPQTPGHQASNSAGSVAGFATVVKRPSDTPDVSTTSNKRPGDASDVSTQEERQEKKRRIAPTLVPDPTS